LVGKVSAFGTVIFAVLTWWLPEMGIEKPAAYKAAFLFQCIALVLSLVFLGKVQLDKKNVQ
ncbi:MAG: hypothetical protein JW928_09025, partial [Candidatus Aureabacteria bacterium]|nr:hypothetical protein [Candidatus Auribacterota bacterium]